MLVYLFIYVNYNNYEKFETNTKNVVNQTTDATDNSNNLNDGKYFNESSIIRITNGSSPQSAFRSAKSIVSYNEVNISGITLTDNYYWINLPVVGPQFIYCITDTNFFDGGWMLALRGTTNSKNFNYDSKHWTTNSTLNANYSYIKNRLGIINNILNDETIITSDNYEYDFSISSIGELIFNIPNNEETESFTNTFDAKFNTFNYYKAKEWLIIFYNKNSSDDIIIGGNETRNNNRGWVWYEDEIEYNNKKDFTLLKLFQILNNDKKNINLYKNIYKNKENINNTSNIFKMRNTNYQNIWSLDNRGQFYGINNNAVRFGLNSNNNIISGIGIKTKNNEYSAGDFIDTNTKTNITEGLNKSFAFEWYVR